MKNDIQQALAAALTPELVRAACEEARLLSRGVIEVFYEHLASELKRRVAIPAPDVLTHVVVLMARDGGVRAVLDSSGTRFIEPRSWHADRVSGDISTWFSANQDDSIAPFASRDEAMRAADKIVAAINQPGLRDRLRVVPAERCVEQELRIYLSAGAIEAPPEPDKFMSTQVIHAYVSRSSPPAG